MTSGAASRVDFIRGKFLSLLGAAFDGTGIKSPCAAMMFSSVVMAHGFKDS
jgi:hypothetical protein